MATQDSGKYSAAIRASGVRLGVNEPLVAAGAVTLPATTLIGAVKVLSGAGAPSLTAPKGSLYCNTTATTTATRLYINTDGATTWTAFTSAA